MMPMSSSVSCRREHRGRLVEHEHVGVARQGLDDLDPLLNAHRQIFDLGVGVDVEAEAARNLAHELARGIEVEQPACLGLLVPEHDVLGDGEHGDEHEVLVHHADAGVHRVAWAGELLHDVVEHDLALVGLVETVENVHERRLARAVLAQQAVDLTGFDNEIDMVVGHECAEALRDAAKLEFHACGPSCTGGVTRR